MPILFSGRERGRKPPLFPAYDRIRENHSMTVSTMLSLLSQGFVTSLLIFALTLLFSMLDFLGIERERTRVEWVSAAEGAKFAATMNDFVADGGRRSQG